MEGLTEDQKKVIMVQDYSGMNNTQFCGKTGISAATLSGIRNGKTDPSKEVLRNILSAFPNINPLWIFAGQGDMLLPDVDDGNASNHSKGALLEDRPNRSSGSDFSSDSDEDFGEIFAAVASGGVTSTPPSPASTQSLRQSASSQRTLSAPVVQVPQIDTDKLAVSIVSKLQKPVRKISEIRIYFDDGTYETFSSH